MAPGRLFAPGTEYGPCIDACGHIDCADTRSMAEAICHYCGQPIGYGTGFYYEHHVLVHSACVEDAVEDGQTDQWQAIHDAAKHADQQDHEDGIDA